MNILLAAKISVSFLFAISLHDVFADTKDGIRWSDETVGSILKIQLAADDSQKCRADCLQQMVLCKQSADSPSKDDNERSKGEKECDLNYRACVNSCR